MLAAHIATDYNKEISAYTRRAPVKPVTRQDYPSDNRQDMVDLSNNAKDFTKQQMAERQRQQQRQAAQRFVLPQAEPQANGTYERMRSQVLGFLVAQGMTASQALPQAEKILARIGYSQREAGEQQEFTEQQQRDLAWQLGETQAKQAAPIAPMPLVVGLNILV